MLQIRLVGPLEVLVDGTSLSVGGGRARSLLAILALEPGHALSTEVLVERCWGDAVPADPKASLHAAIRRLRVVLGDSAISTTQLGYALDVDPEQVDAVAFSHLLDPVSAAGPAEIGAALAMWRGEPFAGDFCDWLVQTERTRLIQLRLSAVERRADLDLAAGRSASVVAELQELVGRYPLRESLWARFLLALSASGRTAEALEQYGVIRGRIADELGVEPGAELRRIFEQLLAGEAVTPAVPPPEMPTPQQLPTDVSDFHGRKAALADLDRILAQSRGADGPTDIVVLHGLGGAGKTSLAVHWAHQQSAAFPDGTFFVNLHGYGPGTPTEPAAALEGLLHGLGISGTTMPSDVDGRSALLRSALAGRRVLMVLDNARNEEQVRPLLPGSGGLVVITSRSRMRGLAVRDHAVQLPVGQLSDAESVALLGTRLPHRDTDLLADLARKCSQLPLALTIAAEQIASRPEFGLEELVGDLEELGDRLEALDSGDDQASNLRAVFSWSYRALDERTARFFRLLGVIPVPVFSTEAAAAVTECTMAAARSTLRRLADLHLVTEIAPNRFQLHDLLRAYAGERVQEEETGEVRWDALERLLDWYNQAVRAVRVLAGSAGPLADPGPALPSTPPPAFPGKTAAQAWLEQEFDALLVMVAVGAQNKHPALAARLAVQIWDDLYARAVTSEAMTIQSLAISCASAAGLTDLAAAAANQLGITYGMIGRLDEAIGQFEAALEAFTETDNAYGLAITHANLGLVHGVLESPEADLRHLSLALEMAQQTGLPYLISGRLNGLAMARLRRGDHAAALSDAQASLALIESKDDRRIAQVEDTVGHIYLEMGEAEVAADYFARAWQHNLDADAPALAVGSMMRHGDALRAAGRNAEARTIWEHALAVVRQRSLGDLEGGSQVRRGTDLMPTRGELLDRIRQLDAENSPASPSATVSSPSPSRSR